jgi:hypothetical protein
LRQKKSSAEIGRSFLGKGSYSSGQKKSAGKIAQDGMHRRLGGSTHIFYFYFILFFGGPECDSHSFAYVVDFKF